jgi:hypothetical protein
MLTFITILLYLFIAVAYGRYCYKRYTWKYNPGDEEPMACVFGLFWPATMLVVSALWFGDLLHSKTPR